MSERPTGEPFSWGTAPAELPAPGSEIDKATCERRWPWANDQGSSWREIYIDYCLRCGNPRDILSGEDVCVCTNAELEAWKAGA